MQIGKLNRLVSINRPIAGTDLGGQPLVGWVPVARPWANIRYISGSEAIRADAVTASATVSIRIRHRTDIDTSMRVQHGLVTYLILAVLPDEASRVHVDLVCEALSGVL